MSDGETVRGGMSGEEYVQTESPTPKMADYESPTEPGQ